jgi:TRAP transporter TAXI family solute receptor
MMRRWLVVAASVVLLAASAMLASALPPIRAVTPAPGPVVLATGDAGGMFEAYGRALAGADPAVPVRLVPSDGSQANLRLLETGQVNFAFASLDTVADYLARNPQSSIRSVARLYDSHLQIVVTAELAVHALADLRGLRVAVGSPDSGTTLTADRVMTRGGLDPQNDITRLGLDLQDSADALADERIDAFFAIDAVGAPAVKQLASRQPVRILDITEVAAALRQDHGAVYQVSSLPAGSYPAMSAAIGTLAVPILLLTTSAVSSTTVESFTRLLFDTAAAISAAIPAVAQVDRHSAIFTGPVPLHEGARAYYRATKVAA